MKLSHQQLYELYQLAISAAQEAGRIINSYAEKNIEVKEKLSGDSLASQVVTEVDLLCQDKILEILAEASLKYDLAILTEESVDDKSRHAKDYFWCIDPMDGTLSFINSEPGYAVSIALVSQGGKSQLGVIYDPYENILYTAIKGKGAFRNGISWHLDRQTPDKSRTFSFYHDRSFAEHRFFKPIRVELQQIQLNENCNKLHISQYGGAALNAMRMLETSPACYFKYPKDAEGGGSLWDYAASACICSEAGAWVSDIHGEPLQLNSKFSTFMNVRAVLYATTEDIALALIDIYKTMLR